MLEELLRYTRVADKRVIDTFRLAAKPLPEAERLFSHVLNAQHIWACRVLGHVPRFKVHEVHPSERFSEIHENTIADLYKILKEADLQSQISYSTSNGKAFTSKVADILLHVLNHSTYHRAQIATLFRQNGVEPPVTDYIFLQREDAL